jgi:hypothetical protein
MSADIAMTPAATVELQLPLAAAVDSASPVKAKKLTKKQIRAAAAAKGLATRMSKRIAATGVVSIETLASNTAAATATTPALAITMAGDDVSVAAGDEHVTTPKTPAFADSDTVEAMSTTSAAPAAAEVTGHIGTVGGGIWSAPAVAAAAATSPVVAAAPVVPDVKAAAPAEAPAAVVISPEEKATRVAWLRGVAVGIACSCPAGCKDLSTACKASSDRIAALLAECQKAKTATNDKFPYCYVCQKALKTAADLDADNDCKACHVTPMCYHFSLTNAKFGSNWDAKTHAVRYFAKHAQSGVSYCGKCLDNTQRAILPSGTNDAVATVRRMVKAKWFKANSQTLQDVEVDQINPAVLAALNASHASTGAIKLEDIDTESLATIDKELIVDGHINVNAVEEKALAKIKIDQVLGAKIRSINVCDLIDFAEEPALFRNTVAQLTTFTEATSTRKVLTTLKSKATAVDEKKNAEAVKPPAKKKARTEKGAQDKDTTDSDTDADKPKAKAKAKSATDSDADDKPKAKAKAKASSGSKRKTFDDAEVLAAARVIMAHAASKEAASEKAAADAKIKSLEKQVRLLTAAAKSKERTAAVMSATSAAN